MSFPFSLDRWCRGGGGKLWGRGCCCFCIIPAVLAHFHGVVCMLTPSSHVAGNCHGVVCTLPQDPCGRSSGGGFIAAKFAQSLDLKPTGTDLVRDVEPYSDTHPVSPSLLVLWLAAHLGQVESFSIRILGAAFLRSCKQPVSTCRSVRSGPAGGLVPGAGFGLPAKVAPRVSCRAIVPPASLDRVPPTLS